MKSHFWQKEGTVTSADSNGADSSGADSSGAQYKDIDVKNSSKTLTKKQTVSNQFIDPKFEEENTKKSRTVKIEKSGKINKKKISIRFNKSHKDAPRVATGIEGLDELVEGGVKKHSVVLVEGGAGSGKSIFCMQYLINGIEMFGESGVFISFEEEKEEVYENMLRFGWDLQKFEDEGKFTYLRYNPEQIEKIISGGGGLIRDSIEKIGAKRIVIDSMTAFIMLHDNELAKREATLSLFRVIKKWGCTALVVGQPDSFTSDYAGGFDVLEFECDAVIRLYNTREHNMRSRSLEVLKMRGTKHASKTYTLEISDDGVIVYPDENTF